MQDSGGGNRVDCDIEETNHQENWNVLQIIQMAPKLEQKEKKVGMRYEFKNRDAPDSTVRIRLEPDFGRILHKITGINGEMKPAKKKL